MSKACPVPWFVYLLTRRLVKFSDDIVNDQSFPLGSSASQSDTHDDDNKWKHFPCYWSFVRGIRRSPVDSHHKGMWRGALMFSFICAWINGWINNHEADDHGRHGADYGITVMNLGSIASQSDTYLLSLDASHRSFLMIMYLGIIQGMGLANEGRRYIVTSTLIGWAHI